MLKQPELIWVLVLGGVLGVFAKGGLESNRVPSATAGGAALATAEVNAAPMTAPALVGAPLIGPRPGPPCLASDEACLLAADFPPRRPGPSWGRVKQVRAMIALVADPSTSGFETEFDYDMASLQRAAESQGYVTHRHWLPWSRELVAARRAAGQPGWIAFRRTVAQEVQLLVLFLVGERVGSGLDSQAFEEALQRRGKLRQKMGLDRPERLLILGPHFSGTALSLRTALIEHCKRGDSCANVEVEIVSGSASRRGNKALLSTGLPFGAVRFAATINSDDALVCGMRQFLKSLNTHQQQIAELTESSTDFGVAHTAVGGALDVQQKPDNKPLCEEARAKFQTPYPLHLEGLRAGGVNGATSVDLPGAVGADAGKQLQLLLDATLGALRRQGVTDVGIFGSSTADKVDLVNRLRAATPDVRAHVYEASIGLADREHRSELDGTLVAASYPLFPDTQTWTGQSNVHQFPSDAAQGAYNAFLALLSTIDEDVAKALPSLLRDYAFPFGPPDAQPQAGPAVWVSVIVAGKIWPMAAYSFPGNDYVFASGRKVARPQPRFYRTMIPMLGMGGLWLLVVANLLGFFRAPGRLGRALQWLRSLPVLLVYQLMDQPSEPGAKSQIPPGRVLFPAQPEPQWVLIAGCYAVSLVTAVMAVLFSLPHFAGFERAWLAWFVPVLLTCLACCVLVTVWAARSNKGAQTLGIPLAAAAALTVVHAAHTISQYAGGGPNDGRALLFFSRLQQPGLGLTPTIPVLIMAATFYVACLFRLRVIRTSQRLTSSSPHWEGPTFSACAPAMRDFATQARGEMTVVVLLAGIGGGLLVLMPGTIRSLEGRTFDVVVSAGYGVMFGLALACARRAWVLWTALRAFLEALAVHPAAPAFARLPLHIARRFQTPMPGHLLPAVVDPAIKTTLRKVDVSDDGEGEEKTGAWLRELQRVWFAFPNPKGESSVPQLNPAESLREDYLAIKMTENIAQMCDITRTMLFIAAGAAVAGALAAASYPFQPAATLSLGVLVTTAVVVLSALRVILGIERNELIGVISKSKIGEVTASWALGLRLIGYVAVPIATALMSRLPQHGIVSSVIRHIGHELQR